MLKVERRPHFLQMVWTAKYQRTCGVLNSFCWRKVQLFWKNKEDSQTRIIFERGIPSINFTLPPSRGHLDMTGFFSIIYHVTIEMWRCATHLIADFLFVGQREVLIMFPLQQWQTRLSLQENAPPKRPIMSSLLSKQHGSMAQRRRIAWR